MTQQFAPKPERHLQVVQPVLEESPAVPIRAYLLGAEVQLAAKLEAHTATGNSLADVDDFRKLAQQFNNILASRIDKS